MADPIETLLTDESEDQYKGSWDFWRADGTQIDTIAEMGLMLCMADLDVASMVLTYPTPEAVPLRLLKEAADVVQG